MTSDGSYAVGLQYAVKKYWYGLPYQSHSWYGNWPTCSTYLHAPVSQCHPVERGAGHRLNNVTSALVAV